MNTPHLFAPIDYESILSEMTARFLARLPEDEREAAAAALQLESEWITILLQTAAYEKMTLLQQINEASAANLVAFASGDDLDKVGAFYRKERLQGESDERFRVRIQLAADALGAMGTAPYYRGLALDVATWVLDAAVIRSGAGTLTIAVHLSADAPADALEQVAAAAQQPGKRMATDTIVVSAASPVPVMIKAMLRRESGVPAAVLDDAVNNLSKAIASRGLGSTTRKSWLAAKLMIDGISDVTLLSPATDIVCDAHQFPVFTVDVVPA